jgi:GMP synthase-like glutamine amidotransferase
MKIGILRCGHTPDEVAATHGQYEDMFARLLADEGLEFRTWSVVDMAFPESPEDAEGWLVSGSRHGAYDALPFIAPLEDFIRRVVASGRPLVGICFGHQLIAQALGGTVVKFPRGWSVGAKSYDWDGLGEIWLTAWHQDQVIAPPEGARGDRLHAPLRLCRAALRGPHLHRAGASRVFDAESRPPDRQARPGVVPDYPF